MGLTLGIVGAEAAKFTKEGRWRAKHAIYAAILKYEPDVVASGHCHLGGVDIWAEDIATELGCATHIFPPRTLDWAGFKPRNIRIAEVSKIVVCITVDRLPSHTVTFCYHHNNDRDYIPHVKTGGCWTTKYAGLIERQTKLVIVKNY